MEKVDVGNGGIGLRRGGLSLGHRLWWDRPLFDMLPPSPSRFVLSTTAPGAHQFAYGVMREFSSAIWWSSGPASGVRVDSVAMLFEQILPTIPFSGEDGSTHSLVAMDV